MSTTERGLVATLTAADVLELVREALGVVLERDPSSVTRATTFAELDTDSLALVEVAEIVEERLAERTGVRLHIPDADLESFGTVGDAVDYALERLG